MISLFKHPPDYLWLLFTSPVQRDSELSNPLLQGVKAHSTPRRFVSYDNDRPVRWVLQRAQSKGLKCSQESAQLLIDLMGNDLTDLDQELEKLSLLHPDSVLDESFLSLHIQAHKHYSVFRLTDSMARKDLRGALETLDQQMAQAPRNHVRLYMLMVQQFRKMLLVHALSDQRMGDQQILKRLGLPIFLGRQLLEQARRFKRKDLETFMISLAEKDLEVKFNAKFAHLLLKDLKQHICRL